MCVGGLCGISEDLPYSSRDLGGFALRPAKCLGLAAPGLNLGLTSFDSQNSYFQQKIFGSLFHVASVFPSRAGSRKSA